MHFYNWATSKLQGGDLWDEERSRSKCLFNFRLGCLQVKEHFSCNSSKPGAQSWQK